MGPSAAGTLLGSIRLSVGGGLAMIRLLTLFRIAGTLTACGRLYWQQDGHGQADFDPQSCECATSAIKAQRASRSGLDATAVVVFDPAGGDIADLARVAERVASAAFNPDPAAPHALRLWL
jgi:hypothetical protein